MERIQTQAITRNLAVGVDQRTADRITWATNVARVRLRLAVHPAVLIRRALAMYVDHLERVLESPDVEARDEFPAIPAGRLRIEEVGLRKAAKGETRQLHPECLSGPVVPFSAIERSGGRPPAPTLAPFGEDVRDEAPA